MTRSFLLLAALVAAAGGAVARADAPPTPRLIEFNPWAWIQRNHNQWPLDYLFPPSRTPKQSTLDPPADRTPPKAAPTTTNQTPAPTTIEERSTTPGKKIANKTKSTVPATNPTATAIPKIKKTSHKTSATVVTTTEFRMTTPKATKTEPPPTKTTSPLKTTPPPAKLSTATFTPRPTKHYTITPIVHTTDSTASQDTDSTQEMDIKETESTETVSREETASTAAVYEKDSSPTLSTAAEPRSTDPGTMSTMTEEPITQADTTAAEPADSREGSLPLRTRPTQQTHVKITDQREKETVPLPAGSTSVLAKPTKYHYYPHNQHIYLLPECAIQQVCNAVYVRLNYTQPLCACPARYRDPCSASLNADDLHTTRLTTDSKKKYAHQAVTLVKTCEAVSEMRECRVPRDWSLLALQNIRTGKSHYLVICRCPENHILEGPMSHDQPTYASVPGIRVFGMVCVKPPTYQAYNAQYAHRFTNAVQNATNAYKVDYSQSHSYGDKPVYNRYQPPSYMDSSSYNRRSRIARFKRSSSLNPPFPWHKVKTLARSLHWI